MFSLINPLRLHTPKRAFSTRNVSFEDAARLTHKGQPKAGDLVLAKVTQLGHHQRIELVTGRRSRLFVGDEIIVAYGNRYATDQFEATVPECIAPCCLVAAGGIAATLQSRSSAVKMPTRIEPLGLICREDGSRVNVKDHALVSDVTFSDPVESWVVLGSGMNTGKTTTMASLIRGARKHGRSVAALKITGTGAGGDLWHYLDAGAQFALDFTDAGYASTAGLSAAELNGIAKTLMSYVSPHVDFAVIEIADGLLQRETAAVLTETTIVSDASKVIFATCDPLAAESGIRILRNRNIEPVAISGVVTASELASREAVAATGIASYTKQELARGVLVQPNLATANQSIEQSHYAPVATAS